MVGMKYSLIIFGLMTLSLAAANQHYESVANSLVRLRRSEKLVALTEEYESMLRVKRAKGGSKGKPAPAPATAPPPTTAAPTTAAPTTAAPTTAAPTSTSGDAADILSCTGPFQSATEPASVHALKFGDIDVVAAMGDSLTAAAGASATSILASNLQDNFRGKSFSAGGDATYGTVGNEDVSTFPNILKMFNPNLYGYSVGVGDRDSPAARLNVARNGDIAQDMPEQANLLIARMTADPAVDMANDWKMINLFIASNNLCHSCNDGTYHSKANFKAAIQNSLDILRAGSPRTIVNLVDVLDVTPVADIINSNFLCATFVSPYCPCVFGSTLDGVRALALEYQAALSEIIDSGRYDGDDSFTVVLQPFLRNTTPPLVPGTPNYDTSFFAPDCFHFSEKGHDAVGIAFWNSAIAVEGSKQTDLGTVGEPARCPTTTFIPTRGN